MLDKQHILEMLCAELKERPIIQFAVKKAGISRSHFYRFMKDDPEFARRVNEATAEGMAVVNDFSVSKLLTGINNDNLPAIFFWLKHKHPDFSNRLEVTTILQTPRDELTPEQQATVREALRLAQLTTNKITNQDHEQPNDKQPDHGTTNQPDAPRP